MKQWKVEYAVAMVHEDSYEEGEGKFIQEFELHEIKASKFYDSLEQIIKKVNNEFGCKYTKNEFGAFEGNKYMELVTDILVDENNYYVDKKDRDHKQWEAGEIILYNAYVAIGLSITEGERAATEDDFMEEGITDIL